MTKEQYAAVGWIGAFLLGFLIWWGVLALIF